MFAVLERAVGDLAQKAGLVVQRADIAIVDLVGPGLEMVVAQDLPHSAIVILYLSVHYTYRY